MKSKSLSLIILLPLLGGCFAQKVGLEDPSRPGSITLKMGPMEIKKEAGGDGHNDHADMIEKSKLFKFRQDGWITSFNPAMKNDKGESLPAGILHHTAVADHGEDDYLCKDLPHKARLMLAAGSELTSFQMPEGYGIPINKKMEIALVGMFNSKSTVKEDKAYFLGEVEFTPSAKGTKLKDIIPIWIDVVENCDPMGYKVYSSSSGLQIKDRIFKFPFTGKLMLAGGHMHSGGRKLTLLEEKSGKVLVSFTPEYDDDGNIQSIPLRNFNEGINVATGVNYIIRSEYKPNTHHDIDAMGIIIGFVVPAEV